MQQGLQGGPQRIAQIAQVVFPAAAFDALKYRQIPSAHFALHLGGDARVAGTLGKGEEKMPLFLGEELLKVTLGVGTEALMLLFERRELLRGAAKTRAARQNFRAGVARERKRQLADPGLEIFSEHVFEHADLLA